MPLALPTRKRRPETNKRKTKHGEMWKTNAAPAITGAEHSHVDQVEAHFSDARYEAAPHNDLHALPATES